jgi:hypothetical protein
MSDTEAMAADVDRNQGASNSVHAQYMADGSTSTVNAGRVRSKVLHIWAMLRLFLILRFYSWMHNYR